MILPSLEAGQISAIAPRLFMNDAGLRLQPSRSFITFPVLLNWAHFFAVIGAYRDNPGRQSRRTSPGASAERKSRKRTTPVGVSFWQRANTYYEWLGIPVKRVLLSLDAVQHRPRIRPPVPAANPRRNRAVPPHPIPASASLANPPSTAHTASMGRTPIARCTRAAP